MRADDAVARILIAVDALDRSADVLAAVTRLAAGRAVELSGLFVEDADLLALAGWPAATERRVFDPAPRPFGAPELAAALRAQALALQRRLDALARELGAPSSFRTVRGRVVQEALSLAGAGDCVVMASASASLRLNLPAAPLQRRALLWLLPEDERELYRLAAAAAQCDPEGAAERRLVLPEDAQRAAEVRAALPATAGAIRVGPAAGWLERAASVAAGGNALVLMTREAGAADPERLRRLLRRAALPLVLV